MYNNNKIADELIGECPKRDYSFRNIFLNFVIIVTVSSILFCFFQRASYYDKAKNKLNYNIIELGSESYAIITQYNNKYILCKAKVEENILVINKNEQKIINTDNIKYIRGKFDKVNIN